MVENTARPKLKTTAPLGIVLVAMLTLSAAVTISTPNNPQTAVAQPFVQTVKHRDLILDLGNGVKTNAQLTIPAIGNGPFPGVLLISGSGAVDMNETMGPDTKPFWQISQYLSERGFVVFRYDKRGVGANSQIIDPNVWGNITTEDLKNDAEKALTVLASQPEVDAEKITLIGHSEGTVIVPRIVIDQQAKTNPTVIQNIILLGSVATNFLDLAHYQKVGIVIDYMDQVLDKNHTGIIPVQAVINDPLIGRFILANFGNDTASYIDIDKQIKPLLEKQLKKFTIADDGVKCENPEGCPIWFNSFVNLEPNLSIIGNLSKSTSVLMLNGESDPLAPVQQSFLLQQRLNEVNHPDHTLITYPGLGHSFELSSSYWTVTPGPIEQYVLSDISEWLTDRTNGHSSSQ